MDIPVMIPLYVMTTAKTTIYKSRNDMLVSAWTWTGDRLRVSRALYTLGQGAGPKLRDLIVVEYKALKSSGHN